MNFKKMIALVFAALLIACVLPNYALAEGADSSDLAAYLEGLIGTPAKEWGRGSGTQCVELPKFYIEDYYKIPTKTKALGNGNSMYKYIPEAFPHYFQSIKYSDGFKPQVGDVISFQSNVQSNYGHAAVVYAVNGNEYSIIEQSKGCGTVSARTVTIQKGKYGKAYTIIGVARPTSLAKNAGNVPPTHTFGDWETVKKPTCTEKGQQRRVCKICGQFETKAVAALGHKYGEAVKTADATCTAPGKEKKTCLNCGKTATFETALLPHVFGTPEVVLAPTHEAPGLQKSVCLACGEEKTEEIPMLKPEPEPEPTEDKPLPTNADVAAESGDFKNGWAGIIIIAIIIAAAVYENLKSQSKH